MISAEQFLDLLEKKDLLEPKLIRDLRKRVAQADTPVKATLIAQRLVDKGHLSKMSAKRLLQQVQDAPAPQAPQPPKPARDEMGLAPLEEEEDDELGLAPLEEEMEAADIAATEDDDWGLELVDDKPLPKQAKKPLKAKPIAKPAKPAKPPTARPVAKEPAQAPPAKPPQKAVATPVKKVAPKPEQKQPAKPKAKPATTASPATPAPAQGSLESLFDESGSEIDASQGELLDAAPQRRGLFRSRRAKKNVWDSNLLLFGGGGLLIMVIVLIVIVWAVYRRNPEEMLNQANQLYRDGTYTQAIDLYDQFLEKYSDNTGSSLARIKLGLARMRQATSEGGDWPNALKVASEELEQISGEDEFMTEARAELAAMLPDIADGLSQLARNKLDPALVDSSVAALELVDKYLPSSARPATRLTEIRAVLDLTRREISRGEKLQQAISAMKQAVDAQETGQAYGIRRALIKEYPNLAKDKALREAVLAVSQAELGRIEVVAEERKSLAAEPDATMPPALALVKRTSNGKVAEADGRVVFAVAQGAAYGLDAASGKVLWRRHVGFASDGRGVSFPSTAASGPGGKAPVLADWEANELLQLDAATGAVNWRFPVGERFDARPVAARNRLLLGTRSGRLFDVDAKSGTSARYVQLPQELRIAPVVDPGRDSIYQMGEHSSLFVLSLESGEAKQVVYLGHDPGSVVSPPVLISGYLVVAENDGIENSTLNVLALDAQDDKPPVRLLQQIPIKGHTATSPSVSGARLMVVSNSGNIYVFEMSGDNAEKPLGLIADGPAADDILLTGNESLIRFPFLAGGQAWVADSQVTRYDVMASKGTLQNKWIQNPGSPNLQPPKTIGQTIFQVRHKLGMPGVLVAALDVEEGNTVWETLLAAPLVREPWIDPDSGRVMAVSTPGAVFSIDPAQINGDSVDVQPTAHLPPTAVRRPLTDAVPLGGEAVALVIVDGPDEIRAFDPKSPGTRFRPFSLSSPAACRPAVFSGGLLIPVRSGQTLYLDLRSGTNRTEPFQPPLQAGVKLTWREPVPIGDNEILLTDGIAGLYRVGIEQQPKPHLAALASAKLAEPIVSPVAVLGDTIYAVDKSQSLVSFSASSLEPGQPRPLSARLAWGPRTVGDRVLLTTEDQVLYSIDTEGKVRTGNLPHGPLAGTPIAADGHLLFASTDGVIWKVDPASGEETGSLDTKLPLQTGPVLFGERLLVGGRDGSLYQVDKP